jgi:hypothetical protein
MTTFRNHTGCPLLLETWVADLEAPDRMQTTRVPSTATVDLPDSASGSWAVYLADPYSWIGNVWTEEQAGGSRTWTAGRARYSVAYVPPARGRCAFYVAWARPTIVRG